MTSRSRHADDIAGIKTQIQAGALANNHNQARIKTKVRAGRLTNNHNQTRIKTKVRAGLLTANHNQTRIKTKVRAGALTNNHNQSVNPRAPGAGTPIGGAGGRDQNTRRVRSRP
jgi:hypothetical protein